MIVIATIVVVCAFVIIVVAAIIGIWLCLAHRRKLMASDLTKSKESALLVTPQSNETLFDMMLDGTGSGSG